MDTEFLSVEEIDQRYSGEWVLVEELELDEQLCLVGGIVTMHHQSRDAVQEAMRRYPYSRRPFTIRFFGPQPERLYLLGVHQSQ